jgi:NAD(P)H-flavin reductase
MLLANAERPLPRPATLFWGLRSQADMYYVDEFARLSNQQPGISSIITLSQPTPGWGKATGRVTNLVHERIRDVRQLAVYLCGNSAMIKEVSGMIQAKGLCPIFREKYYDDVGENGGA